MKVYVSSSVLLLALTGCVQPVNKVTEVVPENAVTMRGELAREQRINQQQAFSPESVTQHYRQTPVVTLDHYARNLVHELMANHHRVEEQAMVAVTDLAFIDTDLQQGSVFTNHLSEAIMYDLHKFGVAVLDYKVTDYIRVTPTGDFALSRDFSELTNAQPMSSLMYIYFVDIMDTSSPCCLTRYPDIIIS